jgi:hypothetical protein
VKIKKKKPGKTNEVIDIGCGIDAVGDVNIDIENVYTQYGCKPGNFIVASAMALPFKEKSFKRANVSEVLEHLDDDDILMLLEEVKRVAEKATFTVPNAYFIPGAWKYSWTSIGTDYREMMRKCPHIQVFDRMMLTDLLTLFYDKVRIYGKGTWVDVRPFNKLLALLARRIPFLSQTLIAHCE